MFNSSVDTPQGNMCSDSPFSCSFPGSEKLSERLMDALQTGIIFFDSEGVIQRINLEARRNLHVDVSVVGRRITDILSIVYRDVNILPDLLARFREVEVEDVRLPNDTFMRCEEGCARFFVQGLITRLDKDEFLLSFRNIVDELTQEYMLKMALSSTKIFPWYYDMEREVMVIDSRYFDYTGIPTKDNTMSLEDFGTRLHPDDQGKMADAFGRQLSGEHFPYPVEFRLLRGDGQFEWFEGQSSYLGQVEGLPFRVVGICMSTQTHKDIEESLISARDKAEQSDRLKSAFLANMSHEIRTPLNAIVGFSNLLTGGDVSLESHEAKEYTDLINTNCNHLLSLISDVIDLSRIETNTMEYHFSRQSLYALFSELYQKYKSSVREGIDFNLMASNEYIQLDTDAFRLRQVIDNLLVNAMKFTAQGYINLGYQLSEGEECVEMFVEDTGCGIPEDQQEKIFERFYKVDSFVQGAGLGLSICKTIAERLGGTIRVVSRLREGSKFILRLPLRR